MNYIDSEIILQRKIGSYVYVYIMIIIVIMLSIIIFFILFNYKIYYTIRGTVIKDDDHFYIRIYIPINDIKYITTNNSVIIDKKEYKYIISMIDSEYFTDNIVTYQIVKIDMSIDEKYKMNNLTLDLKFLRDNKRIIDYFIE